MDNATQVAIVALIVIFGGTGVALADTGSPPEASFTHTPETPNPDDQIELDASGSADPDGEVETYEWDTDGDGVYGEYDEPTGQTATTSFGSGGTYTIGLKVTDTDGNTDTTTTRITVDNPAPTPTFSYDPTTPNPEDTITLDATASSDPDGTIETIAWDTDDDGIYGDYDDPENGETARISFDSGGTYTVSLKVIDNGGKERTISKQITVDNPAPNPSYSSDPSTPNPDDTITLDASDSSDPDGTIETFAWDTDDDGIYGDYDDPENGETARISYDSGGTYTVGLKVTDNGGKERTVSEQITVKNPAPEPSFSYEPTTPNPDDTITLDATASSDPDGTIETFKWDTDDDGIYGDYDDPENGETARISFDSDGTYSVSLKVIDNGGKARTVSKQITVENPAPEPGFSFQPQSPNPDDTIALDASKSSDPDGTIETFKWDTDDDGIYGDYDDPENGETARISFDSDGTYIVSLKVIDNGGKERTVSKEFTVENPPPTPTFSTSLSGLKVTVDGSGSADQDGTIESYDWYVGDSSYPDAEGETATFQISEAGTYPITLSVQDNGGKTNTTTKEVGVSEPPKSQIKFDGEYVAAGHSVQLRSASHDPDGSIESYIWTLPDGTKKYGDQIAPTIEDTGEYVVELTVVDDTGNEDTTTRTVIAKEPPELDISWVPEQPRNNLDVVFIANSSKPIQTVKWDFENDGHFEKTGEKAIHSFTDTGKHNLRVQVTDQSGITTIATKVVAVQKSATFDLSSQTSQVESNGEAIVTFQISNQVPDKTMRAKLNLDLPSEGASISSVSSTNVVGRSETGFVSVPPGGSETLQVRIQLAEPGSYDISGNAVFYIGNESDADATRRTESIGPATIEVQEESASMSATSTSAPGFTGVSPAIALLLVAYWWRR